MRMQKLFLFGIVSCEPFSPEKQMPIKVLGDLLKKPFNGSLSLYDPLRGIREATETLGLSCVYVGFSLYSHTLAI